MPTGKEGKEEKGRNTSKKEIAVNTSPAKAVTIISSNKEKEVNTDTIIIVNGRKLEPETLKSFTFQWSDKTLLVELNYELPMDPPTVKIKKDLDVAEGPSTKGISILETNDPEIYLLEEEGLLKLGAMSALRTNKENEGIPVSKLKTVLPKKTKYETEVVELSTDKLNITEVASMAAALNDLAVREQKIQRNKKVIKVEEVLAPKIVICKDIFYLTEKFKLYKMKE